MRRVRNRGKEWTIVVSRYASLDVGRAVTLRPGEDRLNVEALPLPLLVVGRDPFGGQGLDVVDAQNVEDRMDAGDRVSTRHATLSLLGVRRPAIIADEQPVGCQPALGRTQFGAQSSLVDAIRAALVIDEAARAKLCDGQEACALEIRRIAALVSARGDEGVQRQPGEIVAGQEALGREIAVGKEICVAGRASSFEQNDLLLGLRLTRLGLPSLVGGQAMDFRLSVGLFELSPRSGVKLPPTIEAVRKPTEGARRRCLGKSPSIGRPRRAV